jgi:NAD(P)-dependent dehydrogenase (short-subunit alcohol dehydrogenase family)
MSFAVKNSVALVTGANRGIGKTIVESLLNAGAQKVYAAVRNTANVDDLAASSQGRVVPVRLDLADPDSILAAAKVAGDVQLVVNNAGVLRAASPLAADAIDALQFEMNVNVYGLLRMAQAFAPVLAANGGGAFVQLNSVASLKNFADFATYSASKAAAYSLTQGLREKLQAQGTRVISVHPGPIATDMADAAGLTEIAEPPSLVAEGIVAALAAGEFHVFPDSMARSFWSSYQRFAKEIVEAEMAGG